MYKEGIYAGFDCGTMGVRLFVAKVFADGSCETLLYSEEPHTANTDLSVTNSFSRSGINSLINAHNALIKNMKLFNPLGVLGVATGSFRVAKNGNEVLQKLQALGVPYRIIDGEEEVDLSFKGVAPLLNFEGPNYYFVDLGGNSTEVALVDAATRTILKKHSFSIRLRKLLNEVQAAPSKAERQRSIAQIAQKYRKEFSAVFNTWSTPEKAIPMVYLSPQFKEFCAKHSEEYPLTVQEGLLLRAPDIRPFLMESVNFLKKEESAIVIDEVDDVMPMTALMALLKFEVLNISDAFITNAPSVCAGAALSQALKEE